MPLTDLVPFFSWEIYCITFLLVYDSQRVLKADAGVCKLWFWPRPCGFYNLLSDFAEPNEGQMMRVTDPQVV